MADRLSERIALHDRVRSQLGLAPTVQSFADADREDRARRDTDAARRRDAQDQRRREREQRDEAKQRRRDIERMLATFARELEYELRIPGRHSEGPTYNKLLEYREAEGRPFAKDTRSLRERVRRALQEEFATNARAPTLADVKRVAAGVILETIVLRVESQGFDVRIKANRDTYRRWKAKHGLDTRAGIRTGEWLEALQEAGRVKITGRLDRDA